MTSAEAFLSLLRHQGEIWGGVDAGEGGRFPRVFGDEFGEEFGDKFGDDFSESLNSVMNLVENLATNLVIHQNW